VNKLSQIIVSLILAGGFCLGTFPSYSVSQVTNEKNFNDFLTTIMVMNQLELGVKKNRLRN
tara:strand:- start:117 stop:299 length:183 start_codon:yes stop_codon:yes gene_type:complete